MGERLLRKNADYGHLSADTFTLKFLTPGPSKCSFTMLNKAKQKTKSPSVFPALSQVIHISIHTAFALSHA